MGSPPWAPAPKRGTCLTLRDVLEPQNRLSVELSKDKVAPRRRNRGGFSVLGPRTPAATAGASVGPGQAHPEGPAHLYLTRSLQVENLVERLLHGVPQGNHPVVP